MRLFFFLLLLFPALLQAQAPRDEKFVKQWSKANNDSVFVKKNSVQPYRLFELNRENPGDTLSDWIDSVIFVSPVNTILGPFGKTDTVFYIRVLNADSVTQLHLGGLTLSKEGFDSAAISKDFDPFVQLFRKNENMDSLCLSAKSVYGENVRCDDITCFSTELQPSIREEMLALKPGQNHVMDNSDYIHLFRLAEPSHRVRSRCIFSVAAVVSKQKGK